MKDCVFCRIVSGKEPAKIEYEDSQVLAFRDIHPRAPVHVLLIPKKHIARLSEAEEANLYLLGKIQLVAKRVAEKLNIADSFRLLMANGSKAGQSVFHIHYHLIGGWKDRLPPMEVV